MYFGDALPKKISLHPYTTITDVGQKDLDIQYIMTHYEQLTRCFKTANDDLGFTQNNFWAKCILQNPTDADLHYYLETALPITDLAECIIDQVSGKISKAISGDAPFFLNAHSIIGERFLKLTFSLKQT
jgi:hypothetical protein